MLAPCVPDVSHATVHPLRTVITAPCDISKQACKSKNEGGVYAVV